MSLNLHTLLLPGRRFWALDVVSQRFDDDFLSFECLNWSKTKGNHSFRLIWVHNVFVGSKSAPWCEEKQMRRPNAEIWAEYWVQGARKKQKIAKRKEGDAPKPKTQAGPKYLYLDIFFWKSTTISNGSGVCDSCVPLCNYHKGTQLRFLTT